jgi:hypothetical protein
MNAKEMSAQTDWDTMIVPHSVYPQGAPPPRTACVERGNGYDAREAAIADASLDTATIRAVSAFGRECLALMARALGREGINTDFDKIVLRRIGKKRYERAWLIERLTAYCGYEYKWLRELDATARAIEKRLDEDHARELARAAEHERARERAANPMRRADFTDAQWARVNPITRAAIERREGE